MRSKNYSTMMIGMMFVFVLLVSGGINSNVAHSAPLVAKTSFTVINVDHFQDEPGKSPKEVIGYDVTHNLHDVSYAPGVVRFQWEPLPGYSKWRKGSTSLTARIWAIKSHNSGRTYTANAWDYIYNHTTSKHRGNTTPGWVGTMISSLCHTNSTCNATERTNIVFWP